MNENSCKYRLFFLNEETEDGRIVQSVEIGELPKSVYIIHDPDGQTN